MKTYSQRKKISALLLVAIFTVFLGVGCGKKDNKADKAKYLSSAESYFKAGKYAEATIEYKNALKYTPKSSVINYKLFKTYLKQKKLQDAFPFLLATLKYNPDNREARFSLAEILLIAKKYDTALKEVEKLLKTEPNDWKALSMKATCLSVKARFDKALVLFKKTIKLAPKELSPYVGAGRVLIQLGRTDEAWKMVKQAEKLKPNDVSVSLLKVECYRSKKDFSNMEKELIKVTKTSPKTSAAFVALAKYYISRKQSDKAGDIVAQAIKINPLNTDINLMDARLSFILKRTDESIKKYRAFLKKHPKNVRAVKEYVLVLNRLQRFDEAKKAVDEFEHGSLDSSPRESLAKFMMLSGKTSEAESEFSKAIKLNKKSAFAYYSLSEIYMQRGELDKSRKFLDKGLLNKPDSVTANVLLAKLYLAKKDTDKARKEIYLLRKKFPNSPTTLNLEARLAVAERKDIVTAEKKLRKSLKINPRNPKTLYLLGNILLVKKDWSGAKETLGKLINIAPNNVDALRGLVQVYYKTGKQSKAYSLISGRVKKYPENYGLKILLAKIYYRDKNKKKSIEILSEAKALAPKRIVAPSLLAGIFVIDGDYEGAIKEYRYILEQTPDNLAVFLKYLGLLRKHKGNTVAAAEAEKFYNTHKSRKGVSEIMGRLKFEEGKIDEAKKYFSAALNNDSKSAPAYYGLGEIAFGAREFANAKKYFSKVLELSPKHIQAAAKLGRIYLEEGNMVAAEKALGIVKKEVPDSTLALNLGAYIDMSRGDIAAAEKGLKKSIAKNSKNPRTLYAMARLLMAKKEWKKSLDTFFSIQKIAKMHMPTIRGIIEAYKKLGQLDSGVRYIADMVKKFPKNYELKIVLARTYHAAKNDKKAIDVLNEAKRLNPLILNAPALMSRILVLNKQYKKAEKELVSILSEHPRYIPALLELGKIAESLNDKQKASKYYKMVIDISPENVMALNNYAWILAEKGDELGKAMGYAQTAKSKLPNSLPVTDTLGWVYLKKNIYTLAISNFNMCVKKEPKNPIYNFHLGLAYYGSGDKKNAKKYLTASLKLKKDFDGSKKAKEVLSKL